jgi:hypothetical protein
MSVNYEALLGSIGEDYVPFEEIKFDNLITRSLIKVANELSEALKANLDDVKLRDSELKQSIVALPVSLKGNEYYIAIEGNDYAVFVNKGVNGLKTKHGSMYSFETKYPSTDMVDNLKRWITKKGIPLDSRYSQTKTLKKKRRAIKQIDEKTKKALGIAYAIKQNGLKPTYFIDTAITDTDLTEVSNALANKFGKQLLVSVEINLTK